MTYPPAMKAPARLQRLQRLQPDYSTLIAGLVNDK